MGSWERILQALEIKNTRWRYTERGLTHSAFVGNCYEKAHLVAVFRVFSVLNSTQVVTDLLESSLTCEREREERK